MSLWKRSLGGMLSGAGSVVFKTGLNLLVIPLLIGRLGLDAFGLYLLLVALLELIALLDLGLGNALVTLLGGHETDSRERRSYLASGHLVFLALSLMVLAGGLAVSFSFADRFHIQPGLRDVARNSFGIMIPEAALLLYSSYTRAILLSHCAHQWSNLADTIYYFIANVGGLALLWAGFDLTAVMTARLAGALMRQGFMTLWAIRLEPFAFRHGWRALPGAWRQLFGLGGHAMMLNISVILSHKIDDVVIARFLPLSAVGVFEIVFRLLGVTIQVALKLSEGAFPLFSRFGAEHRREDARLLFLRLSAFLYLVAVLLIMGMVCHYDILLRLFSANHISAAQTWPILWVAIPCILSGILQMPANALLFTWGHRRFLTVTSLLAAVSNLVLSVILVQWIGLVGVALGTLIPQLAQHQAGLIARACRELGISAGTYLRQVHGALIVPVSVSFLWIQLFSPWVKSLSSAAQPDRWVLLPIAFAAGGAFLLGLGVWFFRTASSRERAMFDQYVLSPLKWCFAPFSRTSSTG